MPSIKISVLALASAVAAVPHYGAHSSAHGRYHSKVAHGVKPYPTGGWPGAFNTTQVPQATGTGGYGGDTTVDVTSTSTTTLMKTVTVKPSPEASESAVAAGEEESGDENGQCGPATVTVTAHEAVTITVTPGGGAGVPESSVAPVESKSMGEGYPGGGAGVPSSAAPPAASTPEGEEKPTPTPAVPSSKVEQPYPTPQVPSSQVEQPYPTPTPVVPSQAPEVPVPSSKAEYQPSSVEVPVEASSAVPSATPSKAPVSGGGYSGAKRGLAYNDAALCKDFGSKFGFAYNWAQVENNDVGAMYVPMMHKPSDSTPEVWLENVDKATKKGSKMVMSFNEPDHKEQANLSPEAACDAYRKYINPVASQHPDVTILGPSVTNGPPPMGLSWLQQFHDCCPDAVMHATNIHFYDIYEDATIDRFQAQIEKAHAQTGLPVYITEFGLNPGSASQEQAVKFLKAAMAYMDGSDIVHGYSWFMVGDGENQLNSGNGLSLVGQAYAS